MFKYTITIALLIGVSQASCPRIGPEMFRETLNNNREHVVIDGKDYNIDKREIPDFAISSPHLPKISVKNKSTHNQEKCQYTRTIGGKKFGSFKLEFNNRDNKKVVIVKEKPDTVIIERDFVEPPIMAGPEWYGGHHHFHHGWRHHYR